MSNKPVGCGISQASELICQSGFGLSSEVWLSKKKFIRSLSFRVSVVLFCLEYFSLILFLERTPIWLPILLPIPHFVQGDHRDQFSHDPIGERK